MAAHPKPWLMTVEAFYDLPERDDVMLELHWGQLVELSRPKAWHIDLQHRLAKLLEERSGADWTVRIEMPFRAVPEYDLRAADIGVVATSRWRAVGKGDLFGPPEIVIEVLSPSNRPKEIGQKMAICLMHGAQQFCVVNDRDRTVSVTGPENKPVVYRGDDEIPFALLGTSIRVSQIWVDRERA